MDNNSTDGLAAVLASYVQEGYVHHIRQIPGAQDPTPVIVSCRLVHHEVFGTGTDADNEPQMQAYGLCLMRATGKHAFLGFWDVDEFLVVPSLSASQSLLQTAIAGELSLQVHVCS